MMWFSSWHDGVRCAAIRLKGSGLVISMERPARHHTILHAIHAAGATEATLNANHEQGFLDRKGKFVDRIKAGKLCGRNKPLLSEDLW